MGIHDLEKEDLILQHSTLVAKASLPGCLCLLNSDWEAELQWLFCDCYMIYSMYMLVVHCRQLTLYIKQQ